MKTVYENVANKYEEIIASIIIDPDLDGIDFPLIAMKLKVDGLKSLLSPELVQKLDLTEEFNFDTQNNEKEEMKESEGFFQIPA
jgi:hypothetical protein